MFFFIANLMDEIRHSSSIFCATAARPKSAPAPGVISQQQPFHRFVIAA